MDNIAQVEVPICPYKVESTVQLSWSQFHPVLSEIMQMNDCHDNVIRLTSKSDRYWIVTLYWARARLLTLQLSAWQRSVVVQVGDGSKWTPLTSQPGYKLRWRGPLRTMWGYLDISCNILLYFEIDCNKSRDHNALFCSPLANSVHKNTILSFMDFVKDSGGTSSLYLRPK